VRKDFAIDGLAQRILRDASLRSAPQDEVFPHGEERAVGARLEP
jgi:hypothetical protein